MFAKTLKPVVAYNECRELSKAVLPPAVFVFSVYDGMTDSVVSIWNSSIYSNYSLNSLFTFWIVICNMLNMLKISIIFMVCLLVIACTVDVAKLFTYWYSFACKSKPLPYLFK